MSIPAGCTEIVPAVCTALAIANCIVERDCELVDLSPENLLSADGLFAADLGTLVDFAIQIRGMNLCIVAGIAQAFINAGCPVPFPPNFPPELPMPDLTECVDELADTLQEVEDKLGYLSQTIDIEFDETGVPTKIRRLV